MLVPQKIVSRRPSTHNFSLCLLKIAVPHFSVLRWTACLAYTIDSLFGPKSCLIFNSALETFAVAMLQLIRLFTASIHVQIWSLIFCGYANSSPLTRWKQAAHEAVRVVLLSKIWRKYRNWSFIRLHWCHMTSSATSSNRVLLLGGVRQTSTVSTLCSLWTYLSLRASHFSFYRRDPLKMQDVCYFTALWEWLFMIIKMASFWTKSLVGTSFTRRLPFLPSKLLAEHHVSATGETGEKL